MFEDAEVVVALIGLIAVGLGAVLSGTGFYLRVRGERLQSKRVVLFYLLEIRQAVRLAHASATEMADSLLEYCNDFFVRKGLGGMGEPPEGLGTLIHSHFGEALGSVRPVLGDVFLERYEAALERLSTDEPVLAYTLRGRESLTSLVESQNNYLENLFSLEEFGRLKEIGGVVKAHATDLNEEVIAELLSDLDSDIKRVAWRCGVWTRYAVRKPLRMEINSSSSFDAKRTDIVLEELLQVITSAAKVPSGP